MPKHEDVPGILNVLELTNQAIQQEASTAFLSKAAFPLGIYEPQLDFFNSHKHIKGIFGANQSGKCLRAESQVMAPDGTTTSLVHMKPGDPVLAYDFKKKDFVAAKVVTLFENGEYRMYRFKHDYGELICTGAHKVCVYCAQSKNKHRMWGARRVSKAQELVVVRAPSGAPWLSTLTFDGFVCYETTYDLAIDHPDHAFVCDNIVVSNSHAAAIQLAWDATGLYPDWYKGPKTLRGINAWVLGDTTENTRDAAQRKLFGPDRSKPGWTDKPGKEALIHTKYILGKPSYKTITGAIDSVWVKHVPSDTTSMITFKTHGMEMQALASWTGDRVWIDEECPKEILDELIARITTTNGYIYFALCPQHGVTPMVKWIRDNANGPYVFRTYLTYEDARHITAEVKERNRTLWASDPAMLAARTEGRETSNSGLIFPFPLDSILYNPAKISISPYWKYLGGLDVGFRHPTAACAGAYDSAADIIYIYGTYEQAEKDLDYHFRNLQKWGPTMTFMIDPASDQVNQADGTKILEKYWELAHGPNWDDIEENKRKFIKANNAFHVGMDVMWHRFQTQRLMFSQNLKVLHDQYASYEWDKDGKYPMRETAIRRYDVITSLRYLTLGVSEHAHRLDTPAPWLESEWREPVDIPNWVPYRQGNKPDWTGQV